ncbi:MAG: alginate O-acetyltransferase AlgX-related protein [Rhodoferax sp.]
MEHTPPSPPQSALERWHQRLACAVLAAVVALGSWQMLCASGAWAQFDLPQGMAAFREGKTTLALEKALERHMPQRESVIAFANALRYRITSGANDQVRLGAGGWIFLTEELRYERAGDAHQRARAELLAGAAQALAAKGSTLVVALVPDKARLYGAQLPGGAYPAHAQERYGAAVQQLRQAGVPVVDMLGALEQARGRGEVYYRTDTHWNQRGAQVAAQQIAAVVAPLVAQEPRSAFGTQASTDQPTERVGDLLRLMGLQEVPNAWRPVPDQERAETTTEQPGAAPGAAGLFGDVSVPVVLTGTSYSLRGNVHGYLQQALGLKVLNVAKDGGGLLQATEKYLRDDAYLQSPPKVLVWEVPERFLTLPLGEEAQWLSKAGLRP